MQDVTVNLVTYSVSFLKLVFACDSVMSLLLGSRLGSSLVKIMSTVSSVTRFGEILPLRQKSLANVSGSISYLTKC